MGLKWQSCLVALSQITLRTSKHMATTLTTSSLVFAARMSVSSSVQHAVDKSSMQILFSGGAGSNDNCTNITGPVDIIFVADASGSIGTANFDKMRNFMVNLVSSFDVATGNVRVGTLRYSQASNASPR